MPVYEYECDLCTYQWEDIVKMSDPLPEECPECKKTGHVKKIPSICVGKVELTGSDLKKQIKEDTKKLKKEIYSSDKKYSNFLGEDRYQNLQQKIDKNK